MARLYDKTGKIVEITMMDWTGDGYTPDWSDEFFDVGGLSYNEELDAHEVEDVEYCIEYAQDWENGIGDFCCDENPEPHAVFVDRI